MVGGALPRQHQGGIFASLNLTIQTLSIIYYSILFVGIYARNETFPCYYSRVNPWIVLERYNPSEMIGSIIASVTIPNVIFVISLIALLKGAILKSRGTILHGGSLLHKT